MPLLQNARRQHGQGAVAKMAVDEPANNAIPPPAFVEVNDGKTKDIAKATLIRGKLGNFEPKDPPLVNAPGEGVCVFVCVHVCVCMCVCGDPIG